MHKLLAGTALALTFLCASPSFAGSAQQVGGVGLAGVSCTNGTVNVGNNQPVQLDAEGRLCVNIGTISIGGSVNATIVAPLGRQADATSVSTAFSTEDVALVNSGVGTPGSAVPSTVIQMGGTDGTNSRGILTGTDGRQSNNTAQINGVTVLMGNGPTGTGAQRVTLSDDNTSVAISIASGTTTQIVAAATSQQIHLRQITLFADAANAITIESGDTGGSCANPVAQSGAMALAINGGMAPGNGAGDIMVLPAGKALCILTTAAAHGWLAYKQYQ